MSSVIKGRDPVSQLYRAVERYVNSNNGSVVVIGGIKITQWPPESGGNFEVSVRCLGRKPVLTAKDAKAASNWGPGRDNKEGTTK